MGKPGPVCGPSSLAGTRCLLAIVRDNGHLCSRPRQRQELPPEVSSVRSPVSPGTGTGPAARPAAVSASRPDDRRDPWLGTVPDRANTLPPAGQPGRGRAAGMARRELHRHVEIGDDERTVATVEVTSQGPGGTAWASLRAESGHIAPGRRASLVDAVLDLPEVQESARLKVVFPLGDTETLQRLQERCPDVRTHPAGASAITDANLPVRRSRCSPGRPPRTLLNAEANGWKARLTRHCPTRLDIFAAQLTAATDTTRPLMSLDTQRLRVLSGGNKYAAPDPGGAGITGLAVS